MPIRGELIDDAIADLKGYAAAGNLSQFFKKFIRLEEVGKDAGLPLGGGLTGWRKIVVGDRNWRILFTMNPEETIATVWVIGDRDDAECYQVAQHRLQAMNDMQPQAASLAAVLVEIGEMQRTTKKRKRQRR